MPFITFRLTSLLVLEGLKPDPTRVKEACESARSLCALYAKLFQEGFLGVRGSQFAAIGVAQGLGLGAKTWPDTELARRCEAEIAAQYILISGEAMAHEIRFPSEVPVDPLGRKEWKVWADGFKKLAEDTPNDAEWELKERAEQAHVRMAKLFPELFHTEK